MQCLFENFIILALRKSYFCQKTYICWRDEGIFFNGFVIAVQLSVVIAAITRVYYICKYFHKCFSCIKHHYFWNNCSTWNNFLSYKSTIFDNYNQLGITVLAYNALYCMYILLYLHYRKSKCICFELSTWRGYITIYLQTVNIRSYEKEK